MNFRKYLIESVKTVYHGDDFNTTKLDPKLMNNGNNQEGIGIYFYDNIVTGQQYGKNLVSASINPTKFIESRVEIIKIGKTKIFKLLKHLHGVDPEPLYYQITDWGIEISEPDDVTDSIIKEHINNILDEEVRNFQITLAEDYGVVEFVEAWNKYVKIPGTYNKESATETWFALIDTSIKLEKVKN